MSDDEVTEKNSSEDFGPPAERSQGGNKKQPSRRTVKHEFSDEEDPHILKSHEKVGPPTPQKKVRVEGVTKDKVRGRKPPQKDSSESPRQVSPSKVAGPSTCAHTPPYEPIFADPAADGPTSYSVTGATQQHY